MMAIHSFVSAYVSFHECRLSVGLVCQCLRGEGKRASLFRADVVARQTCLLE